MELEHQHERRLPDSDAEPNCNSEHTDPDSNSDSNADGLAERDSNSDNCTKCDSNRFALQHRCDSGRQL
jgi:hypothetical protein